MFFKRFFTILLSLSVGATTSSQSCTRVLLSNNQNANNQKIVLVGRTMNWEDTTEPEIWVFPRGMNHKGGQRSNALSWTSKYGTVVISAYSKAIVDGINEMGLAGHALYFGASDYGSSSPSDHSLESGLWLQYILDRYPTVQEAIRDAPNWRIILSWANGHKATLHFALEDRTGDSAIIEYIKGKPFVYHGREYKVLTNAPSYDQHLENLKSYNSTSLPNPKEPNASSKRRFVLVSKTLSKLDLSYNPDKQTTSLRNILESVSNYPGSDPTFYKTIIDITRGRYYFSYHPKNNHFWINLKEIDFSEEGRILYLDPSNDGLIGEINTKLTPIPLADNFMKFGTSDRRGFHLQNRRE